MFNPQTTATANRSIISARLNKHRNDTRIDYRTHTHTHAHRDIHTHRTDPVWRPASLCSIVFCLTLFFFKPQTKKKVTKNKQHPSQNRPRFGEIFVFETRVTFFYEQSFDRFASSCPV